MSIEGNASNSRAPLERKAESFSFNGKRMDFQKVKIQVWMIWKSW